MSKRYPHLCLFVVMAMTVALAPTSLAQERQSNASLDLLDRGAASGTNRAFGTKTHTTPMVMTGTLANLGGTAGVTIGMIMTFAPRCQYRPACSPLA